MAISKAFVQKTLNKHFPKLGDGLISCTYHSTGNAIYDADAGSSIDNAPSDHSVLMVFADFSATRTQSGILMTDKPILESDKKAIMLTTEMPIRPVVDDIITRLDDSTKYSLIGYNVDPYDGAYIFHLRPIEEP